VKVTFDIEIGNVETNTTYFDGADADTPHATDGTLGNHEGRHAVSEKGWWTTDNVRANMRDSGMSTSLDLPASTSPAQARLAAQGQLDEINWGRVPLDVEIGDGASPRCSVQVV